MNKIFIFFTLLISLANSQTFEEYSNADWIFSECKSGVVVVDIDNDDNLDLVFKTGFVYSIYEQDETKPYNFSIVINNIGGTDELRGTPAFYDIDGDGLIDMLIGQESGKIFHAEQTSTNTYNFALISTSFNDITLTYYADPSLNIIDIDNDGLLDLFVFYANYANFHYEQANSNSYQFNLINDNFFNFEDIFYNKATFFDIDDNGLIDIILGTTNDGWTDGKLYLFEQDENNLNNFKLVDDNFLNLRIENVIRPTICDIDGDGFLDLFVSVYWRNIIHYEQSTQNSFNFVVRDYHFGSMDTEGRDSSPFLFDVDGDSLIDLLVGVNDDYVGVIRHYEQEALNSLDFNLINKYFSEIETSSQRPKPTIYDIDSDGLLDLFIGKWDGTIDHYKQLSSKSYEFSLVSESFNNIDVPESAAPVFYDIDNDTLIDLIIGQYYDGIYHYEQTAIHSSIFNILSDRFMGESFPRYSSPIIRDIDNDSLLNLLVGSLLGNISNYEQSTQNGYDFSLVDSRLYNVGARHYSSPCLFDLDRDGMDELIVGAGDGYLKLYKKIVDFPISLSAYSNDNNQIVIEWTVKNESGVLGYNIYRSENNSFNNANRINLSAIESINSQEQFTYQFYDLDMVEENYLYFYWLEIVFINLDLKILKPVYINSSDFPFLTLESLTHIKQYFKLENFPNPFNETTTISFYLPEHTQVKLFIYDVLGRQIVELANQGMNRGNHSIEWNGRNKFNHTVTSGIYIYHIKTKFGNFYKKALLLK